MLRNQAVRQLDPDQSLATRIVGCAGQGWVEGMCRQTQSNAVYALGLVPPEAEGSRPVMGMAISRCRD